MSMSYQKQLDRLNDSVIKYHFVKSDGILKKLTFNEFINLLKSENKEFLKFFRSALTAIPSDLSQTESFSFF
jgi:hypothetical protein